MELIHHSIRGSEEAYNYEKWMALVQKEAQVVVSGRTGYLCPRCCSNGEGAQSIVTVTIGAGH